MSVDVAATVGTEFVTVAEVDAREHALRAGGSADALPRPGTSEARQLRRWITQVLVAERVVAAEASALCARVEDAPAERDLLPDEVARLEIGSVAASTLCRTARPRGVRARHRRGPRSATPRCGITTAATRSASRAVRRRPGAGTARPSAPTSTTCDPSSPGICWQPPSAANTAGGWTRDAPTSWCSPPATNTPAIRGNPTTPIGTDD